VARALARLEDAEAYAVLAAAGDKNALMAIKQIVAELKALHENLQGELPDQETETGTVERRRGPRTLGRSRSRVKSPRMIRSYAAHYARRDSRVAGGVSTPFSRVCPFDLGCRKW
jgi:hypothetical protein